MLSAERSARFNRPPVGQHAADPHRDPGPLHRRRAEAHRVQPSASRCTNFSPDHSPAITARPSSSSSARSRSPYGLPRMPKSPYSLATRCPRPGRAARGSGGPSTLVIFSGQLPRPPPRTRRDHRPDPLSGSSTPTSRPAPATGRPSAAPHRVREHDVVPQEEPVGTRRPPPRCPACTSSIGSSPEHGTAMPRCSPDPRRPATSRDRRSQRRHQGAWYGAAAAPTRASVDVPRSAARIFLITAGPPSLTGGAAQPAPAGRPHRRREPSRTAPAPGWPAPGSPRRAERAGQRQQRRRAHVRVPG